MQYIISVDIEINIENEFELWIYFRDDVDIFRFIKKLDTNQVGIVIKDMTEVLHVNSLEYIIRHGPYIPCGIKYDKEDIIPADHPDHFNVCKRFWITTDYKNWLYLNGGE